MPPDRARRRARAAFVAACALAASDGAEAAPHALVYLENPVRTPSLTRALLPSIPSAGALENVELMTRSCVDGGGTRLVDTSKGQRALRACELVSRARPASSGDYEALPLDVPEATETTRAAPDAFAEVSAFYHAARTLAFFRELGGGAQPLGGRRLELVTSARIAAGLLEGDLVRASGSLEALEPLPGAFYVEGGSPLAALFGLSSSGLVLGQGFARDFAYDGDVIAHEVTHAVFARTFDAPRMALTTDGASGEAGALSEAVADYFAAALAGNALIGEYASAEAPFGLAMRSLDVPVRCPDDVIGEPHDDGRLYASALWAVRNTLDGEDVRRFDALVFETVGRLEAGELSFHALAGLLGEGLTSVLPGVQARLDAAREERGIGGSCRVVRTLRPEQSLTGRRGPFAAPGTNALGGPLAPAVMTLRIDVPSHATALRLRFAGGQRAQSPLELTELTTPFAPTLLAGWDAPLVWRREGEELASTASLSAAFRRDGPTWEAVLPLGVRSSTALYAQIANGGEQSGYYDVIGVAFEETESDDDTDATTLEAAGGCAASGLPPSGDAHVELFVALAWSITAARRRRSRPST